jgi:hypothetical protein
LAALYPDQKKLLLQTKEMVCRSLWRLFSFESISKKISVILDPISSIQKNKTLKQYYLFSYFSFLIPVNTLTSKSLRKRNCYKRNWNPSTGRSRWIPIGSRLWKIEDKNNVNSVFLKF